MNTQPMDEYLNRERLTDLAQFAVPDGHDLWPKIERAARASSSSLATPRTGILSLGLSRAWTAVGILLIAATFAALGFGLAVLVLSNGHDQVPAAPVTPTPAASTASPTPSVSKDPSISRGSTIPSREAAHAKMETILTGETLDRYRALPPAYQEALGLYTWHNLPPDLVPSAVKDKIDQWGDWVFPLPEFLGKERAERFDELEGEIVDQAHLLVSYYVLVLNTKPADMSRGAAMRQFMDYVAPPDTKIPSPSEPDRDTSSSAKAPMVAWPPLEKVLTETALARIDLLGPRLRERVTDLYSISSSGESDIENTATALTLFELFLLKAQPHLEIPLLVDTLTGDDLEKFKGLSEADRDTAESFFQRGLFGLHYVGAAGHPPNSTIPKPTPDILAEEAALAMEWVSPSGNASSLPPAVQILRPDYQEAYGLLPDGPWARKYFASEFDTFDPEEWKMLEETNPPAWPTPVPKLDAGEEFQLRRVIRDAGNHEWLIQRIRSLDQEIAKQFQDTQDEEQRLELFRRLVEVKGKDRQVLLIQWEWQDRVMGTSEAEIARIRDSERAFMAEQDALGNLPQKEFYKRQFELFICDSLMGTVVGFGGHPSTYRSDPGQCDIDKVISLTKEALEANNGQAAFSEDDFREMVEFQEKAQRGELSPKQETPTPDS